MVLFFAAVALAVEGPPCGVLGVDGNARGVSFIEHVSTAEAMDREQRAAAAELRAPVARSGYFFARWERGDIESAKSSWQLLIVTRADGAEAMRVDLADIGTPDHRTDQYNITTWYDSAVVSWAPDLTPGLQVHLVDRLHSHRCTWTVDAEGQLTLPGQPARKPKAKGKKNKKAAP